MKIADRIVIGLCALMLIAGFSAPAFAQVPTPTVTGGAVVAACGTPPAGYPTTGIAPDTVDVHGNKCYGTGGIGTNKTEVVDANGNILPVLPSGPVTPTNADGVVVSYEGLTSGGFAVASTATTSTLVMLPTSGQYMYITGCRISNGSTTVSTDVLLQDGSGGNTIDRIPAPAATTATTGGGGSVVTYGANAPLKVPTQGNGLYAQNATTGSSIFVWCNGFKSANSY